MELHRAIKVVLTESPGMTAEQIASVINDRKLYLRRDKKPVPASQINARISNLIYRLGFRKDGERIYNSARLPI